MTPKAIDPGAPVIVRLERVIAAPPEAVWALHTDVAGWPAWQKDITAVRLDDVFTPGGAFVWTTQGLDEPVTSTIYAVEPERSTLWGGPAAGITGIHHWTFASIAGGTRVGTEESWAGEPVEADPESARQMLEQSLLRWLGFLDAAATATR